MVWGVIRRNPKITYMFTILWNIFISKFYIMLNRWGDVVFKNYKSDKCYASKMARNVVYEIFPPWREPLLWTFSQPCTTIHHLITLLSIKGPQFRKRTYGEQALTMDFTSTLPVFWCAPGVLFLYEDLYSIRGMANSSLHIHWQFISTLIHVCHPLTELQSRTERVVMCIFTQHSFQQLHHDHHLFRREKVSVLVWPVLHPILIVGGRSGGDRVNHEPHIIVPRGQ